MCTTFSGLKDGISAAHQAKQLLVGDSDHEKRDSGDTSSPSLTGNDSKDALQLMWEHLTPLITRESDSLGRSFPSGAVTFPHDCIDIRRCRPFTFCQKVVNKWFHKRTVLIGDAAHVFPPFGGQGIACGIRDQMLWRGD